MTVTSDTVETLLAEYQTLKRCGACNGIHDTLTPCEVKL